MKATDPTDLIRKHAHPLSNAADLDPLMERIGDAKFVLLGEASHGTHEYYTWRMMITQRLIREKGFSFVAVEGDWPDCYRVNRYVKAYSNELQAEDVLRHFNRWPTWMWANWETVAFAEWLRKYNEEHLQKAGFYGLDMYSLYESLDAIGHYLKEHDPKALETARKAMRCFEPYADEGQSYARATPVVPGLCENEVTELLMQIRKKVPDYDDDPEQAFSTEQNALVAVNAEKYYRAMLRGGAASWNIRDRHMAETLDRLVQFHGPDTKAIIWEHNTHIGDARATDMSKEGMVNLGQLAREKYGDSNVVLVGFGSYSGSVIAGDAWGDPMKAMEVPEASPDSWEDLLHRTSEEDKLLITNELEGLHRTIAHRAIGVVYNPRYERFGNYVPSLISQRYDAFIYIDQTTALHPLHLHPNGHEIPETYPFGM